MMPHFLSPSLCNYILKYRINLALFMTISKSSFVQVHTEVRGEVKGRKTWLCITLKLCGRIFMCENTRSFGFQIVSFHR